MRCVRATRGRGLESKRHEYVERITVKPELEQVMIVLIGEATSWELIQIVAVRGKKLLWWNLHLSNEIRKES